VAGPDEARRKGCAEEARAPGDNDVHASYSTLKRDGSANGAADLAGFARVQARSELVAGGPLAPAARPKADSPVREAGLIPGNALRY
jgi:hypothetical protein